MHVHYITRNINSYFATFSDKFLQGSKWVVVKWCPMSNLWFLIYFTRSFFRMGLVYILDLVNIQHY